MNLQTVFFFSLAVVALLLLTKHVSIKRGRETFIQKIFAYFDNHSESFLQRTKYRLFQAVQIARFLILVRLPEKAHVSYEEARDTALREYKKKKEMLMGKKVIKESGAVSFFLRKIKEDVKNGEMGKIEETM